MAQNNIVARIFDEFEWLLTSTNSKEAQREAYARQLEGKYMAPTPQTIDKYEQLMAWNDAFTTIALVLVAFYIVYTIVRVGLGLVRGAVFTLTTLKLLIGVALLELNTKILFALYELADGFVHLNMLLRSRLLGPQGRFERSLGRMFGVDIMITDPNALQAAGNIFASPLIQFVHDIAKVVLITSLWLRDIVLIYAIPFFPIIIALWMLSSVLNRPAPGVGFLLRSIFFVVPLTGLLAMLEASAFEPTGASGPLLKSILIFAVIWGSVKMTAFGRTVTAVTKGAVGTAAVVGTAALVGGPAAAGKAGLVKAGGRPGISVARSVDSDAGLVGGDSEEGIPESQTSLNEFEDGNSGGSGGGGSRGFLPSIFKRSDADKKYDSFDSNGNAEQKRKEAHNDLDLHDIHEMSGGNFGDGGSGNEVPPPPEEQKPPESVFDHD